MTTSKKITEKGRGRPSSYKPKYVRQAFKLASIGANDKEIASFFGVDQKTLIRWKKDFEEFRQSICNGRNTGNLTVKKSLFKRAKGFRYTETTKEAVMLGSGEEKTPASVIKTVSKQMAPDVNACMSILKNRLPNEWAENPQAVRQKDKEIKLREKELQQKEW